MNTLAGAVGLAILRWRSLLKMVLPGAFFLGAASVFCSVMLYVETRREFWSGYHTGLRFLGTTVLLGFVGGLMFTSDDAVISQGSLLVITGLSLTKILLEATVMLQARAGEWTPLRRTARLIIGPLRKVAGFRCFALVLGGALFPLLGLVKKVSVAPGQALSDFNIFRLIAKYWGCGEMFKDWISAEGVFQILKKCSTGQPCDITGIEDYEMLDANGGIQWPWPEQKELEARSQNSGLRERESNGGVTQNCSLKTENAAPQRRLFEDGCFYHADGRAKFIFETPRPTPEVVDKDYPFELLTGRGTSAQWHTQTRTRCSAVLRQLHPESLYVEINPIDAMRLGIDGSG